jgi:hypothetical protein
MAKIPPTTVTHHHVVPLDELVRALKRQGQHRDLATLFETADREPRAIVYEPMSPLLGAHLRIEVTTTHYPEPAE